MKSLLPIMAIILIGFSYFNVSAEDKRRQINGIVDPALTEVIFHNPNNVDPVIFENDHHAINECYRIPNGYLTFISSGEGLFEGYELSKDKPKEISEKKLNLVDEKVKNRIGLYLGIHRKDVEKIVKQDLPGVETWLSYESVKIIRETPFNVITTVIIGFEKDQLVKLVVITSTTS
jgi:hypothetical protein